LELAVDRAAPLALPFRAFVPAGRRTLSLRTPAGDEHSSTVDVIAGETLVLEPRELIAKPARIEETSAVPSAASLLARARAELAAGNTRAALRSYQTLRARHPGSPEARTVLVTIGKLSLDLKQPARALESFETYLAAPGPLGPEALAGKIRALRALGRSADELRAIETYLARYPGGFEAPLLAQRLSALRGR
ncbi:MAG TPA: tetratricopeptide repeat protein, partial [Polyangiaceae bacterium]